MHLNVKLHFSVFKQNLGSSSLNNLTEHCFGFYSFFANPGAQGGGEREVLGLGILPVRVLS